MAVLVSRTRITVVTAILLIGIVSTVAHLAPRKPVQQPGSKLAVALAQVAPPPPPRARQSLPYTGAALPGFGFAALGLLVLMSAATARTWLRRGPGRLAAAVG